MGLDDVSERHITKATRLANYVETKSGRALGDSRL